MKTWNEKLEDFAEQVKKDILNNLSLVETGDEIKLWNIDEGYDDEIPRELLYNDTGYDEYYIVSVIPNHKEKKVQLKGIHVLYEGEFYFDFYDVETLVKVADRINEMAKIETK